MHNIQSFKETILKNKIAAEKDLKGCSLEEIVTLENYYGVTLPESYKNILMLIGHQAGCLVDDREFSIYIDQLYIVNDYVRNELLTLDDDEDPDTPLPDMPEKFFVISSRYIGNDIHFIVADGVSNDTVYYLNDSSEITKSNNSVWEWIEQFVKDAEHWIARGNVDYGRYGKV